MSKEKRYELLFRQVCEMVKGEDNRVAKMANVAALVHETFHFWWTGFYQVVPDISRDAACHVSTPKHLDQTGPEANLVVGPFQGPVACMRIGYGKGVCGTAWKERRSVVVADVEQFPGHIACSSVSKSEIVVPVFENDEVVAVLDIDSEKLGTFDDVDRRWLERVAAAVVGEEREIYLAAGCFWGAEHFFKQVPGVVETEVGFANGNTEQPTYRQVYTDTTGFAETVRVRYNPHRLPLRHLLELYFLAIDPTSLNKQGEDEGTRYRTGIFYSDERDRPTALAMLDAESRKYALPLCVEVMPLRNFYPAEAEHQDYLDKNPQGYCHLPLELFEVARRGKIEN